MVSYIAAVLLTVWQRFEVITDCNQQPVPVRWVFNMWRTDLSCTFTLSPLSHLTAAVIGGGRRR